MLGADSSAYAKEGVLSYNEVKLIGLNQVNFEPACELAIPAAKKFSTLLFATWFFLWVMKTSDGLLL